ncbi:MAG: hypothetical protein ACE149_11830 [Armatimonadota bacterium]
MAWFHLIVVVSVILLVGVPSSWGYDYVIPASDVSVQWERSTGASNYAQVDDHNGDATLTNVYTNQTDATKTDVYGARIEDYSWNGPYQHMKVPVRALKGGRYAVGTVTVYHKKGGSSWGDAPDIEVAPTTAYIYYHSEEYSGDWDGDEASGAQFKLEGWLAPPPPGGVVRVEELFMRFYRPTLASS